MDIARASLQEQLDEIAEIRAVDYSSYKAGSTAQVNTNVETVVQMREELRDKLQERVLKYTDIYFRRYFEATDILHNMKDTVSSSLLFNRYIMGMHWDEVALSIDRDESYTRGALHTKALKEFEKGYMNYDRGVLKPPHK